jgi:hypothetical protein
VVAEEIDEKEENLVECSNMCLVHGKYVLYVQGKYVPFSEQVFKAVSGNSFTCLYSTIIGFLFELFAMIFLDNFVLLS